MSEPTALKCPSCGSFFRAGDFDTAKGLLTCSFCKALMTLRAPEGAASHGATSRGEVPLPPSISTHKTREGLELRQRWFRPKFVFLAGVCVIWNAFLVSWYSLAFASDKSWINLVFPLVHVAVGVGLTYATLAGLFNTTTLRVERRALVVKHAPIPWRGPGSIESARIEQFYVKSEEHRRKRSTHTTYSVWVVLRDKPAIALVGGFDEPDVALYLEQQLERALGLEDRRVPGELARE